jgi:hypothetical protein
VDVCLHDRAVLPPVVPLARAEGDDVHRWTLGLVLEVVAIEGGGWVPPRRVWHVEAPEQAHQRPHTHVHLIEVHEDHH